VLKERLARLSADYPLPERWGIPELFHERVLVNGVTIALIGLNTLGGDGQQVTGSAAELGQPPLERAYFELLERATLLDAVARGPRSFPTRDQLGQSARQVAYGQVFPRSPRPLHWQYARSNGAAAGRSWREACARASWELVERDRVLRSWFGDTRPVRLDVTSPALPEALNEYYEFEHFGFPAASFDECGTERTQVAGVFGFPKAPEAPLVYGFGARAGLSEAVAAAGAECIQRLGFLWGEPIPAGDPPFSPTAEFHQEYFLHPSRHRVIRSWLAGERTSARPAQSAARARSLGPRRFADLTPPELRSKVSIAKAIPRGELRLRFGRTAHRSPTSAGCFHPIP
jgi:hypothetical protein